jgi:hypothetical protein
MEVLHEPQFEKANYRRETNSRGIGSHPPHIGFRRLRLGTGGSINHRDGHGQFGGSGGWGNGDGEEPGEQP